MTDVDPKARIAGVFDRAAPTYEQTGVEFFGPPPRFLVEGSGLAYDGDGAGDRMDSVSLFPAITKIRKFVGVW